MSKPKVAVQPVNPTVTVGFQQLSALCLQNVTEVLTNLESKISSPVNITNWKAEVLGNQKVKYSVTVTLIKASDTVHCKTVNFQPARKLNLKGLVWENVNGDKDDVGGIFGKYAAADLPNNAKEVAALLGYLTVSNLTGKAISAVSGGRALLLQKILSTLNLDGLEVKIDEATSGGNGDHFTASLNLPQVLQLANGGAWRGELVLALTRGSSSGKAEKADYQPDADADEWA